MRNRQETILVIGLGNTLRGDDAIGRVASERLRLVVDPRSVKVIDQCAPTPELAAELCDASLAIFLDASFDGPMDRIATRRLPVRDTVDASAHRLDPSALVGLAHRLYGRAPEAYAITFRGRSFDFSDRRLSRGAEAACVSLVQETLRLVQFHERFRRPASEAEDAPRAIRPGDRALKTADGLATGDEPDTAPQ